MGQGWGAGKLRWVVRGIRCPFFLSRACGTIPREEMLPLLRFYREVFGRPPGLAEKTLGLLSHSLWPKAQQIKCATSKASSSHPGRRDMGL